MNLYKVHAVLITAGLACMKHLFAFSAALMALSVATHTSAQCRYESFPIHLEPALITSGERWMFKTDDLTLEGKKWLPTGKPVAVLVAMHGIQTHAGWFGDLAKHLNSHGWAVYAPNRRDAGPNNQGTRDTGTPLPVDATTWTPWLDDLDAAIGSVVAEQGRDVKLYLMGTSWSSSLCPAYLDPDPKSATKSDGTKPAHAADVDGLILSVPAGLMGQRPTWRQKLGIMFSKLIPPLRHKVVTVDLPSWSYSDFANTRKLVGDKDISIHDSPAVLQPGSQDPLVLHRATYGFLLHTGEMRAAGRSAIKRIQATHKGEPGYKPLLALVASDDHITAPEAKVKRLLPSAETLPQTSHAAQIESADRLAARIVAWHRGLPH